MASSSMLRINLLLLFLARCTLFCSWPTVTAAFSSFPVDYKVVNKFTDWANKYGRVYKDDTERLYRLGIFSNNLEYINNFAKYAGQRSYTIGLNEFADLTNEEFLATHTGLKTPSKPSSANPTTSTPFTNRNPSSVPSSIDWRARGAVTRVKDQGTCGSCWAFSTVAAIEGITKIRKRKLIDLSEQELVDCVTSNFGCGGGWMDHAFSFIISNGGIATETTYPYVGSQGACDATKLQSDAATISGYVDVPPCNETALKFAVAQQPVSVAIDASGVDFQLYTGGIYSGPCGTNLDHAVTVVGYGKNNFGTKYWIVKNSWGTSWGDHGYIYMEKDVVDPEGLCGISLVASYPIVWPTVTASSSSFPVNYEAGKKFTEWAAKYGRVYKNDTERLYRLGVFFKNLEYVNNFAKYASQRSYTIGLNKFADLTNEEFGATYTGLKRSSKSSSANPTTSAPFSHQNLSAVPSSVDWRARGAVTRVKDQGACGSCWAFSTIAAVEGITKIKKRRLLDLSEQELVDCDNSNYGCNGGWVDRALTFIISNGGIANQATYPYVGSQGVCNATKLPYHAASISGYVDVPPCNERALKFAVANQPVSAGVEAHGLDFQLYTSGIFTGPCGSTINQAVTVVGYGRNKYGTKYWIVKLSWGTWWGDRGYIYIERDVDNKEGLCGIAQSPSYPII